MSSLPRELRVVPHGGEDEARGAAGEGVAGAKSTPREKRRGERAPEVERAQVLTGRMLRRALETAEISEETAARVLGITQQQVSLRKQGERRFGTDELYRLAESARTRAAASAFLDQFSAVLDRANGVITGGRTLGLEIIRVSEQLGEVARRYRESTCRTSPAGEDESEEEARHIDQALHGLAQTVGAIIRAREIERARREAGRSFRNEE